MSAGETSKSSDEIINELFSSLNVPQLPTASQHSKSETSKHSGENKCSQLQYLSNDKSTVYSFSNSANHVSSLCNADETLDKTLTSNVAEDEEITITTEINKVPSVTNPSLLQKLLVSEGIIKHTIEKPYTEVNKRKRKHSPITKYSTNHGKKHRRTSKSPNSRSYKKLHSKSRSPCSESSKQRLSRSASRDNTRKRKTRSKSIDKVRQIIRQNEEKKSPKYKKNDTPTDHHKMDNSAPAACSTTKNNDSSIKSLNNIVKDPFDMWKDKMKTKPIVQNIASSDSDSDIEEIMYDTDKSSVELIPLPETTNCINLMESIPLPVGSSISLSSSISSSNTIPLPGKLTNCTLLLPMTTCLIPLPDEPGISVSMQDMNNSVKVSSQLSTSENIPFLDNVPLPPFKESYNTETGGDIELKLGGNLKCPTFSSRSLQMSDVPMPLQKMPTVLTSLGNVNCSYSSTSSDLDKLEFISTYPPLHDAKKSNMAFVNKMTDAANIQPATSTGLSCLTSENVSSIKISIDKSTSLMKKPTINIGLKASSSSSTQENDSSAVKETGLTDTSSQHEQSNPYVTIPYESSAKSSSMNPYFAPSSNPYTDSSVVNPYLNSMISNHFSDPTNPYTKNIATTSANLYDNSPYFNTSVTGNSSLSLSNPYAKSLSVGAHVNNGGPYAPTIGPFTANMGSNPYSRENSVSFLQSDISQYDSVTDTASSSYDITYNTTFNLQSELANITVPNIIPETFDSTVVTMNDTTADQLTANPSTGDNSTTAGPCHTAGSDTAAEDTSNCLPVSSAACASGRLVQSSAHATSAGTSLWQVIFAEKLNFMVGHSVK